MTETRVFVYGTGAACAAGEDLDAVWAAWRKGETKLSPLASPSVASPVFAGLAPFRSGDPGAEPPGPATLALARGALREALGTADPGCRGDLDLVLGTTVGLGGDPEGDPEGAPFGELAETLAGEHGLRRATTVVSGCTSSMEALATAADRIRAGRIAGAVAGGVDAVSALVLRGFECLGMLARRVPRPFDRERNGCALGEGAAFLVLLAEEEGRRRGMLPLAELVSGAAGISDHPSSLVEPEGAALAGTIGAALEAGGVPPAGIAFVQAFALGTALGDPAEANALRAVLGPALGSIPISGTKGLLGHTLGAAGALDAALAIRALRERTLPAMTGLVEPDPACALPRLLREEESVSGNVALQVGVGLCGQSAALLWRLPP
ncbi:MAG: beta-ketoacyl synthase N-terminal-like domain-containing protein [Planctomycetota bacterium]